MYYRVYGHKYLLYRKKMFIESILNNMYDISS